MREKRGGRTTEVKNNKANNHMIVFNHLSTPLVHLASSKKNTDSSKQKTTNSFTVQINLMFMFFSLLLHSEPGEILYTQLISCKCRNTYMPFRKLHTNFGVQINQKIITLT